MSQESIQALMVIDYINEQVGEDVNTINSSCFNADVSTLQTLKLFYVQLYCQFLEKNDIKLTDKAVKMTLAIRDKCDEFREEFKKAAIKMLRVQSDDTIFCLAHRREAPHHR